MSGSDPGWVHSHLAPALLSFLPVGCFHRSYRCWVHSPATKFFLVRTKRTHSLEKAVSTLQKHLYGTTSPTTYKFTVFHFEIVDGNFYMRPDKFDTAMQKLFFPLPIDNNVTEKHMQYVWEPKYEQRSRWPKRWNWKCTFMDNIQVRRVHGGTLKLDMTTGRFMPDK